MSFKAVQEFGGTKAWKKRIRHKALRREMGVAVRRAGLSEEAARLPRLKALGHLPA